MEQYFYEQGFAIENIALCIAVIGTAILIINRIINKYYD